MEQKIIPEWKVVLAIIVLVAILLIATIAWLIKKGIGLLGAILKGGIGLLGAALSPRYDKVPRSRK